MEQEDELDKQIETYGRRIDRNIGWLLFFPAFVIIAFFKQYYLVEMMSFLPNTATGRFCSGVIFVSIFMLLFFGYMRLGEVRDRLIRKKLRERER